MSPARTPRAPHALRLLRIEAGTKADRAAAASDLPALLRAGDLVVLNDAATLPASLKGSARGREIEVRLAASNDDGSFQAVLFGAGDWRTRTEDRPSPEVLAVGESIELGPRMRAKIEGVSPASSRLLTIRLQTDSAPALGILEHGRPIQYSHLADELALWDVQNAFSARPWAFEYPSAGRFVTPSVIRALRAARIEIAWLTHAAGISSSGDAAIDALLPMRERYQIPIETADAVTRAHGRRGRVIAIGTTVARALEGASVGVGRVKAGRGSTEILLGASSPLSIVSGIVTGFHEEGSSHLSLLQAFAPRERLASGYLTAAKLGFLAHEFGDVELLLAA
jgi:S-adenosylmethionine:tRNA ribosyltransferase-isomerase